MLDPEYKLFWIDVAHFGTPVTVGSSLFHIGYTAEAGLSFDLLYLRGLYNTLFPLDIEIEFEQDEEEIKDINEEKDDDNNDKSN